MTFAVVKLRSSMNVKSDIRDTMDMLKLSRVNHCVLIQDTPENKGMLRKAKDYITWGEVDVEVVEKLLKERALMIGKEPLTDKIVKEGSPCKNIKELAAALTEGSVKYRDVKGVNPIFRLHPPRKGGYEGLKRAFKTGGALGYRGKEINALILKMI